MGDLISRSALIEAIIQHGKDVKCSEPILNELYQGAHRHIIDLVELQATAYDVEKVEAELEKQRKEADYWSNDANDYFSGKEFAYCDAITKVRRGGVE